MIIAKKKRSYANSIYKTNFLLGLIIDIDLMKSEKRIQHRKLFTFLIPIALHINVTYIHVLLPIILYNCLYIDQGYKLLCTANN